MEIPRHGEHKRKPRISLRASGLRLLRPTVHSLALQWVVLVNRASAKALSYLRRRGHPIEVLMLEAVLPIAIRIVAILGFIAFFVGFYEQTKFIDEWMEDHAKSMRATTRWRLSTTAVFSRSLSERCRRRRRRLLFAMSAFWALLVIQGLMILLFRSLNQAQASFETRGDLVTSHRDEIIEVSKDIGV